MDTIEKSSCRWSARGSRLFVVFFSLGRSGFPGVVRARPGRCSSLACTMELTPFIYGDHAMLMYIYGCAVRYLHGARARARDVAGNQPGSRSRGEWWTEYRQVMWDEIQRTNENRTHIIRSKHKRARKSASPSETPTQSMTRAISGAILDVPLRRLCRLSRCGWLAWSWTRAGALVLARNGKRH
jgi:hypothetical protein